MMTALAGDARLDKAERGPIYLADLNVVLFMVLQVDLTITC